MPPSAARWALAETVVKPFYWHKTEHGLYGAPPLCSWASQTGDGDDAGRPLPISTAEAATRLARP